MTDPTDPTDPPTLASFDVMWGRAELIARHAAHSAETLQLHGSAIAPARLAALDGWVDGERDAGAGGLLDRLPLVALRNGVLLPGLTTLLAAGARDQEDALLAAVRSLDAPLVALLGPVEPGTAARDLPLPAHAALGYVELESDAVAYRTRAAGEPELPRGMRPAIPVQVIARVWVEQLASPAPIPRVRAARVRDRGMHTDAAHALASELRAAVRQAGPGPMAGRAYPRRVDPLEHIRSPGELADYVAIWMRLPPDILASLLAIDDVEHRLRQVLRALDAYRPLLDSAGRPR